MCKLCNIKFKQKFELFQSSGLHFFQPYRKALAIQAEKNELTVTNQRQPSTADWPITIQNTKCRLAFSIAWFLLLCRIHFPWLFPRVFRTKWIVFPDSFVHAKYQCQFTIACNHTRNKGDKTNLKVEVQIICMRSKQEKFWTVVHRLRTNVENIFFAYC